MATEIRMPQMGESIAEGTLTRWFKKPGDSVKRDEPLFEISTDKVDAEVPAPSDGVLQEILVEEGTTVEVNSVVAMFGDGAAGGSSDSKPTEDKAEAKAEESAPKAEAPAAEEKSPEREAAASSAPAKHQSAPATASDARKVRSSPLVRKIARENGIDDLSQVPGTGVDGRVTKKDILGFVENGGAKSAPAAAPAAAPAGGGGKPQANALPTVGLARNNVEVHPMTNIRRKIAEHMIDSRRTSAHVHSVFEADMTNIVKIRERNKKSFEERHGVKLTFMSFFIKAVSDAIRNHPWVNASLDGDEILIHKNVNMGMAVALDGGLIVPVIRGTDELNIVGIQRRVADLANRARSKQLVPDEITGGTFTITNPGQFGGLYGIPIINQPQVAILGIGGIEKRPVVVEGDAIAVRSMCYLCLGYDHRLVDGAYADQFMAEVKYNLENFDESNI